MRCRHLGSGLRVPLQGRRTCSIVPHMTCVYAGTLMRCGGMRHLGSGALCRGARLVPHAKMYAAGKFFQCGGGRDKMMNVNDNEMMSDDDG